MSKLPLAFLGLALVGCIAWASIPKPPSEVPYIEAERAFQGFRTAAEREAEAKVRGLDENVIGSFVRDHNKDKIKVPDETWTDQDKTQYQTVVLAYREAGITRDQGKRWGNLRTIALVVSGTGLLSAAISALLLRPRQGPTGHRAKVAAGAG